MDDKPILTIDSTPNKVITVSYYVPDYGDYIKVKRLYPYPTREGEQRPPYSVEELLFAYLIVELKAKGKPVALDPQDLPSRLEPFAIDDRQYAMLEFISTCFPDDDQQKAAKNFAMEQRRGEAKPTLHIPGVVTPNGRSYTFERPNTGVQWKADNNYKGASENGCTLDEYMLAMCLTHVDNKKIEPTKDPIDVFASESIELVQFLAIVFVNAFLLDDDAAKDAKNKGKLNKQKLRAVLGNTKSATRHTVDTTGTSAPQV